MTEVRRGEALSMRPLGVLLVESAADATLILSLLRWAGYDVKSRRVEAAVTLRAALLEGGWDVVISDHELGDFGGLEALAVLHESELDLPFIVVSSAIGEEAAVALMHAGAHDYVPKASLTRLVPAVKRELREAAGRRDRRASAVALAEDKRVFEALAHVGRRLISCSDTKELLNRLGQVMMEVLGCDSSFTLIRQPTTGAFVTRAAVGGSAAQLEELRALELPELAMAGMLRELQEHEIVQVITSNPQTPWAALPKRFGITAMLYLALREGDEIFGVQAAGFVGRDESFSKAHERIAQGSAQLASLALRTVRLVEELDRVNRLKSDFAATMSHELRTPLNVFMGYNDMLLSLDLGPLTPEQDEALRLMKKSSRQLLDLITAVLDLSRLDRGRETMQVQDVDVLRLLGDLERKTLEASMKGRIQVSWVIPVGLPTLRTDVAKLSVILQNLLSNALKFTSTGAVIVTALARDAGIEISVVDTGIGIAPEVLPIMFDLFQQGDGSSTRRFGGVGVGLYIARRLIAMLHGTIAVEATSGGGATFRVFVPSLPGEDKDTDVQI